MHGLILLGWLSASAPGSGEPARIEVPVHTLASREHTKSSSPGQTLLDRSGHATSARQREDGSIEYGCKETGVIAELHSDHAAHREDR